RGERTRLGTHVSRHAGELGFVIDGERPRVRCVEKVVVELSRELGELLFDYLEARLARLRELDAPEPKIAQLVRNGALLCGIERGERRRFRERPKTAEELHVLREIRKEGSDLRQIRVIRIA